MKKIIVERAYTDKGTFGKMYMPSGKMFDTVELPWKNNANSVSCIPEGTYTMKKRVSGVVQRTSRGMFTEGWEITNVKGRTFIMIHIGNVPSNFEGCIGVGIGLNTFGNEWGVSSSAVAFQSFMSELEDEELVEITIRTRTIKQT